MAGKSKKQSNKVIISVIFAALVFVLVVLIICVYSGDSSASANGPVLYFTWFVIAVALGLAVYFILASKLNKDRCPKCKMVNEFVILRDKEISHDTKLVTKKIQKKIRDANGQILKTTEEIGQVTVVDSLHHQQRKCKNCYQVWDVTIKKHLEY